MDGMAPADAFIALRRGEGVPAWAPPHRHHPLPRPDPLGEIYALLGKYAAACASPSVTHDAWTTELRGSARLALVACMTHRPRYQPAERAVIDRLLAAQI